jgi:hypothetical protein
MHNGYKMDIHSRTVADSTLALLDHVLGRAPCVNAVVFEMLKEAIPAMGLNGLANELLRLRGVLEFLRSYDVKPGRQGVGLQQCVGNPNRV